MPRLSRKREKRIRAEKELENAEGTQTKRETRRKSSTRGRKTIVKCPDEAGPDERKQKQKTGKRGAAREGGEVRLAGDMGGKRRQTPRI